MLPLYHILLLISSDWLGPEAGTGHFCALAEGKRALLPLVLGDRANRVVVERRRETKTERERGGGGGKSGRGWREKGGRKKAKEREAALDTGFLYRSMPTGILYYPRTQTRSTASISHDPKHFRLNPDRSAQSFATVRSLLTIPPPRPRCFRFSLTHSLARSLSLYRSLARMLRFRHAVKRPRSL